MGCELQLYEEKQTILHVLRIYEIRNGNNYMSMWNFVIKKMWRMLWSSSAKMQILLICRLFWIHNSPKIWYFHSTIYWAVTEWVLWVFWRKWPYYTETRLSVKSLWLSDAIWQHKFRSTLLPDGTKPLPKPMLNSHQSRFCRIHLRAISQQVLKLICYIMNLKRILLKLLSYIPEANELTHFGLVTPYGDTDLGQHGLR